ncbi:MAG: hypothetical protein H0T46_05070 [Deltaproteobacteria bacterium]|nr:hypothetical protein [Deltaproteobacteria bacterium]
MQTERAWAVAAIEASERPDVALHAAFKATDRPQSVIRFAANILPLLNRESVGAGIFRPYPTAREAVNVYVDNPGPAAASSAVGRAAVWGAILAFVVAYGARLAGVFDASTFRLVFIVLIPLLTVTLRTTFAWVTRRQVQRLDDESAFAIVVGEVTRATDRHPDQVYTAMMFLRRNLIEHLEGPKQ